MGVQHPTPLASACFTGAALSARDDEGNNPLEKVYHKVRSCPCLTDEPGRQWGATVSFLERATPMESADLARFVRGSWELHVVSSLQQAAERDELAELCRLLTCYAPEFADARDVDGSTALLAAAEAPPRPHTQCTAHAVHLPLGALLI